MLFFCLFQSFAKKEYQTESKQNETFGNMLFGTNMIQETWSRRHGSFEEATRRGGAPYPLGAPPYLVAALKTPLTCSRCQNLLYIPKLPEHSLDREFRHRKPL